jgi:hypothetical protein
VGIVHYQRLTPNHFFSIIALYPGFVSCKLWLVNPTQDTLPGGRKREEHLSKDGRWRSFPRVPHLLQYVSNGNYYGRIKLNGKLLRESLQTSGARQNSSVRLPALGNHCWQRGC